MQICECIGMKHTYSPREFGSLINRTTNTLQRKSFLYFMEMVEQGKISEIVVAHKDRLVRFGFEWFEKFCKDHGVEILVMNAASLSPEEEMTKDLHSIIHCFSSRLYGLR